MYEGQTRFDVIYGTVTNGNTSATAGVQKNDTAFDQYFCDGAGMPATGGQSYILQTVQSVANANGQPKRHANCHSDGYRHGDSDCNCNANCHGDRYGFGYANRYG